MTKEPVNLMSLVRREMHIRKKESPLGYINSFWRQMILKNERLMAACSTGDCGGGEAMEVLLIIKQS